ncbi:MAG: aldehyde dehydrogenase family protein, partial [Nitrosomonas sp.]
MDKETYRDQVEHFLAKAKKGYINESERCEDAIALAAILLQWGEAEQSVDERRLQQQLARMMKDPTGKLFAVSMTDQCFRSSDQSRVVDQLIYLIKKHGVPRFLSLRRRIEMYLFRFLGKLMPMFLVPLVKRALRLQTARVILPGEPEALARHLEQRQKEHVRVNLNHLGEAVLGEEEAQRRLDLYIADLAKPNVNYISVKISNICSQLNLLDWDYTLHILSKRLRKLYRAAMEVPQKFVNLDMEEYDDLGLTLALFKRVLDEPEFKHFSAGIVLQAYIPDSFGYQQDLTTWAMKRVAEGGAQVKIRIVKGANLAMEKVTASVHGWPQAPYSDKEQVDANFKRMVMYGMVPDRAAAVHLGIGSHNLFDIAFALLLKAERQLEAEVTFEMLEGMADHLRRVVQKVARDILLYCPVATADEFQHAIAYLIRRLDENTAAENFLRHVFDLKPGTDAWTDQVKRFRKSCEEANFTGSISNRVQDRSREPSQPPFEGSFANEADTDWSTVANRRWLSDLLQRGANVAPQTFALASVDDLEKMVIRACDIKVEWAKKPIQERSKILWQVAQELRKMRASLMSTMIYTCDKSAVEADLEIQEAIDFVEYYRRELYKLFELDDISWKPKGVILVAPPWNFPCSISTGGIAAALATGNTVLFKPAPEALQVGYLVAQAFWNGGVDKDILQFVVCTDELAGASLVQNHRVDSVILTGSTATARHLIRLKPDIDLIGETGGKNAIIVTRLADRELAIRHVVQSAFGHSGQKCSACSLLICEAEVYDDPHFRNQLRDAVASLAVGASWELRVRITPLVIEPTGDRLRAMTTLDEEEEWLLQPKQDVDNPRLWSPGIKMHVKPGSFTHLNEFFCPLLTVMRAESLDEAIAIANQTPYGLTSGLHSLDPREHQQWIDTIQAGNLYINRTITG